MTLNEAIYLVLEVAEHYRKDSKKGSIVNGKRLGLAIENLQSFLGDYYINERYVKRNIW